MWFAQHLYPAVPVNIAQYVELRGALELDALRQACADAGREIGSAFVRIFEIDAQPYQIIDPRSEEHTSELQSLMRISYAVFCLKKKNIHYTLLKSTRLIYSNLTITTQST